MERSRTGPGCIIFLVVLILGVVIGASGMSAFLGVGLNDLVARTNGQAAIVLVQATPTFETQIIGGTAPGRRLVWRSPIPLDDDTRDPNLLVISRNYDRDSDTIMLFSPDAGAVRWESAPLGDNGNSWVVAFNAEMIIVADESTLIGLSRADGGKVWEAPLTDKIAYNICEDCLQVFDDAVVALAGDGQLQAFSASKGAPLWQVRLNQSTRQLVRMGDLVGVPDSLVKDGNESGLFVYDPQDGSLDRTIAPSCKQDENNYEDYPHYYDYILADPQSHGLYWMLDSAYCLVRVSMDVDGNEQRTFNHDFQSIDPDHTLVADGAVYSSIGKAIIVVDMQGNMRTLVSSEDYELTALEARSDALLVLAQRTRGSSRLELWLIDPQSGAQRWSHVLKADDPIDGAYDDGDFSAHLAGQSVALIEQWSEPEEIHFDRLSLTDGTSSVSTQIQVEHTNSHIRGVVWGSHSVWLAFDDLYGISLESGGTIARWP